MYFLARTGACAQHSRRMPLPASHSRTSRWQWAQVSILVANLAWTTLCLGGYRPETMVVSTALTGLLLAVHFVGFSTRRSAVHPASWLFLPFLVYAAANVAWVTPLPWLGWIDWIGWAQMIAVFWVVLNGIRSSASRRALFIALAVLGAVSVLIACYQRFVQPSWLMLGRIQAEQYLGRPSGPFGIPNSFAAFLLLLLPALGYLGFSRGVCAPVRTLARWLTLVLGFGFVLTISRGGWIALALALIIWPLMMGRVRWARRLGLSAAMLGAVLVTGAILFGALPKARGRFAILMTDAGERARPIMWKASWELFRAEPAWGTGAGSYNVLFEKHRPEQFRDEPQWAHNEYLNTLSDYGAVGFILFFGPCAVIAFRCVRRSEITDREVDWNEDPAFALALGVGLIAFAVQLLVDFHFKIPALAMTAATVSGLAVGVMWPPKKAFETKSPVAQWGFTIVGAGCAGAAVLWVVPQYRGEALRYRARQAIDQLALAPPPEAGYRLAIARATEDLVRAVTLAPKNGQAWSDLSYVTTLTAHADPARTPVLGREAEAAAERALAISQVNSEFWIRRGVARDMQARWLEAGTDFTQATSLATRNAWVWYYYADHLSRKPTERYMAQAALAFCLRLDPGNRAGLALRQRLAISQSAH
jgi:O-antigen ligase